MHSKLRMIATAIALLLAATACSSRSGDTAGSPTNAPSAAVQPPAALAKSGTITYCSSLANPPREYKVNGQPTGSDVELGAALAKQMGLSVKWVQSSFDGLIPGLLGKQCDMIVEELFIKPEREAVVKMIPYSTSAEQTVVRKGNPEHISDSASLSGKQVGVTTGTGYQAHMLQFNKELEAQGKQPAHLVTFPTTADMYNQLNSGTVNVAGGTVSSAVYYAGTTNGNLELAGDAFGAVPDGLALRKTDTELYTAVTEALKTLMSNGTYASIFRNYKLQAEMLPPGK